MSAFYIQYMRLAHSEQNPAQQNVSRVVGALLGSTGRRQADLAPILHLAKSGVSAKMTGHRDWTVDDIVDLAAYFNVPAARFFEDPTERFRTGRRKHALSRRFSLVAGGGDRTAGRAELCAIQ